MATRKKMQFSKRSILARVRKGPVKLRELARGSENHEVRKRLMLHVDALVACGAIKKLWIAGFPHYVTADYEVTDEQRMQMLLENARRVDGCLVWADYIDPSRGPIGRVGQKALSVRRFVWSVKREKLPQSRVIRMLASCEEGCIEYTHMRVVNRNADRKGRAVMPAHRHNMTLAVRARLGKLDWDKVRAIRASHEPAAVLAERFGVTRSLIGQVRRHEIWVEAGGLFTGLMNERKAA